MLREVEVFRPYDDEIPERLLLEAGAGEAALVPWLEADLLRIAKCAQTPLGLYALNRGDSITYELHGVLVAATWRRQGLGRWLLGHAIGVTESKGGRHLLYSGVPARRFFRSVGFIEDPRGLRFALIPE